MADTARKPALRILHVEDDMGDAHIVRSLLERVDIPGLEIKHIDRIHDALAYLRHTPVDLILLDVELPDSAAIRFDVVYLRRCSRAPIILVTGMPKAALTEFLKRHPSLGFLSKADLNIDNLRKVIEQNAQETLVDGSEFDIDFEALVDTISLPFLVIDRFGRVKWHNEAARPHLGAVDTVQRRIAEGGSLPHAIRLEGSGPEKLMARIDPIANVKTDGLFAVTIIDPAS